MARMCVHQVPLLMPIQHLVSGRAAAKKARLLQHNSAASEPAFTPRMASNNGPEAKFLLAGGGNIAADSYDSSCDGSSVLPCQSSPGQWAAAIPSVVLVSVPGSGWASGIVMSQDGFILTNAHVVSETCKLRLSGSADWHVADIVYVFKHVLDLAVLRIRDIPDSLRLQPAVLQRHAVSAGQPIAVVGHALFSPDRNMQPSITSGNVSKVLPLVGKTLFCRSILAFRGLMLVLITPRTSFCCCIGSGTKFWVRAATCCCGLLF